ncbi:HECT-domain-containing protein [Microstroma glucosiphilum]|uniref:HECT-type E3 ubiquitin transferase n=1 Tax=Pseudomicrostroma glucosiphilum TaxID=1684307 RepID=A0A316UCV8_9BASI|nr:HECT-domain-containing protein [Pseudomicrostroma glucosiphilum]PWN20875.1 HECT-domain-containing protein [Pseudomicrostroma glucosiphilum]
MQVEGTPVRNQYIKYFSEVILRIPVLPNRLPLLEFAQIAANFPLSEVVDHLQSFGGSPVKASSNHAIHQLANILSLSSQRITRFGDGKTLASYLAVITSLQDQVPVMSLTTPRTSTGEVDADTQKRLAVLPSVKHVSAILAVSAKSPSTTRPALYAFLCSLLFSWPEDTRNTVFNIVLYGLGVEAGIASTALAGGFVREIWRGYLRSSPLSRSLGNPSSANGWKALRQDKEGWPALVLLLELYSKLLLTLGDDEFLPPRGGLIAVARNPLSIDEVLSFGAVLRNLAFSLYWELDPPVASSSQAANRGGAAHMVPGLRLSFLTLRDGATRLLQQLHARDARHRFTPEGFWLMTKDMDIESFVESVLLEEDKIAGDNAEAEAAASEAAAAAAGDGLAFISPRLGILNNLPFVLPFATRVEIFETFVFRDARRNDIRQNTGFQRRKRVTIRRDHVAEDGMAQLNGLGSALKESIEIVFVDQFGMQEAGIDGGGVFKEFLTSLAREAFDTDRGLWKATEQEELFPNPQSYARQSEQLSWYAFLGRILGKALYEGILVDVRFAPFFLSKCLGRRGLSHLDDLASLDSLDSELYRGLIYLKNYTGDVEQDLSLNFTVTDEEFGVRKSTELMPNGANIAVTNKNRLSYIFLVANYRLDAQIRAQCNAFFAGLSELIDPRWLRIFNQTELQELIKGSDSPINIADLRANTVLSDYHEKDLTMTYLWETLESFDQPTRAQFLKFVTSCPSPPLLGFGQLNPRFCVRCSGDDEQRLPTSSTCVNLLKLPRYNSLETTREKLLLAIRSGAGFDLS